MANLINNIQNNVLAGLASRASGGVMNAIQQASGKTGVNFAYLVQQANAESGFNPQAKAKTSSATGLYQFIERTWLSMVDKYGARHGISTEGKSRDEILSLRNDPQTASLMAAEFANENKQFLQNHWDGEVGSTELYFAHFMGAGGAAAFLKARDENPMQDAALIFPKEAKANRNVFYDQSTGRAKTLDEVYAHFDKKFTVEDSGTAIAQADIPQPKKTKSAQDGMRALNSLYAQSGFGGGSVVRRSGSVSNPFGLFKVENPIEIMMLAQLSNPLAPERNEDGQTSFERRTNQLYNAYPRL